MSCSRQVTELIYKQRIFRITGLDFKATSNNGNCINANKFRTGSLCLFLQFWNDHRFNPTSIEWEDRGQRLLPRIFSAHLAFGVDLAVDSGRCLVDAFEESLEDKGE